MTRIQQFYRIKVIIYIYIYIYIFFFFFFKEFFISVLH